MDVTCDRCSTEYEFEEALVSPRGTTVKCTQCGHLFKVHRNENAANGPLPGTHWTVRGIDGSSRELEALGELTQLILQGLVTRDDEVSRTGKAWRRLGDIDELETFFAEADRRGPSRDGGERTYPGLPEVAVPAPEAARESKPEPVQLAVHPAADHGDPDEDALTEQRVLPQRSTPTPSAPSPSASSPAPAANRESTPARKPGSQSPSRRQRPQLAAAAVSAPVRAMPLDSLTSDREFERSPRQGHRPWPLLLSIASVIGLASFWFFSSPPTAAPSAPPVVIPAADPAQRFLERGDLAFAEHRLEKFPEALDEYMKALGYYEQDAHILSSISRTHAVWAQELRFKLEDERAPSEQDVSRRSEWLALAKQADSRAEQALRYAETAARKNPTNSEAQVALSDAMRLNKDLRGAREELRRARASESTPSNETLRVAALLEIAEANGDARAGRALAAQAANQFPETLRAKLLLARCMIADGDLDGARPVLREVLTRDPKHPSALALMQLLSRPSEQAPAETAAKSAEEPNVQAAQGSGPAHAENLSHEGYITRGQTALESGAVNIAKRAFEQALYIKPSSAPAHTGLGYVALEKGRPQLAIEHFQAAARGGSEDAYIGLGEAYRRLGRNRDALRAYQSYLTRSPNGDQLSIARAQVERLGEELGKSRKAP